MPELPIIEHVHEDETTIVYYVREERYTVPEGREGAIMMGATNYRDRPKHETVHVRGKAVRKVTNPRGNELFQVILEKLLTEPEQPAIMA
jgi:hypothetical protein